MQSELVLDDVTKDERTMALLAHLSVLVLGIIGPAVIYAIKASESKFIAYHALQALVYQAAAFVIVMVVAIVTCGVGAIAAPLVWIPGILWAIKANDGKWEGYPLIDQIGRPPELSGQ